MRMYLSMNLKAFAVVSTMVLIVGMLAVTNAMQPVMAKDNPTKDNPTKDNPTKDNPTKDNPTLVPGNSTNSTSAGLSVPDCPPTTPPPVGVEGICVFK
jgi:hypothetical protein